MEQQKQRKFSTGEGLRNGDVVNKDRISELPEALLIHILSSLPTETVIATSVLSKTWKSLWKMMPNLKFDSEYHHRTFFENVCGSLILHKAPVLQSLNLTVGHVCDAEEVGVWIAIAFARNVRKLELTLYYDEEKATPVVEFPSLLCRFDNNTLEVLKLSWSILFDLPSPACFKSLRELNLYDVHFNDDESFSNLLCGCPVLEDLVMYRYSPTDVEAFTIAVPSLQRLTVEESYYAEGVGGYVISTPALKYLNIKSLESLAFCLIEKATELVEATISDVSEITNENILESLTSTKRLSLSLLEINYPTGIVFYQLVYLELYADRKFSWNLLTFMLERSPKLQILKIIDSTDCRWEENSMIKWKKPKCVPECLLFHLETFVWTRYDWQREDEIEVATYILKNATQLKKATFSTKPIKPTELDLLEKRRQRLNELTTETRALASCRFVFESE